MQQNKSGIARIAAVAVAAPLLALTTTTSASASATASRVSWENVQTGKCLNWENTWNGGVQIAVGGCSRSGPVDVSQWRATTDGKYWTYRPSRTTNSGDWTNVCLTSYNTLVYLETCQDGNWWQQWEEIWTSSGWKLKHRGDGQVAGYFLDTNGSSLYTEPGNQGLYQVWK
ncbi:hypothetical protein ACFXPW_19340 [Streptomyces goshikiensis]|uniref:hypothetical protein n=1 Tax=Streptomyces goshikiensis TaxID=1942 RepID=UPI003680037B